MRAVYLWLALAIGSAPACGALPEIAAGECGNRVIEAGETCDGIGHGGARCRPPGAAGQCQLDCAANDDGTRPACPPRYGCDEADVCRKASGGYDLQAQVISGNAFSLMTGDFDGNGRADVLSQEAAGVLGTSKFRVQYFGRDGARSETSTWPRLVTSIAIGPVSDDGRSDLVFTTDAQLGVLLGQGDRSLISETYPTYVLPDAPVRVTGALTVSEINLATPLLVITEIDGELKVLRPDDNSASLQPVAALHGRVDQLVGNPVIGDLFVGNPDDPCLDTILALRGASEAYVYSVCTRDAETGGARWREVAIVTRVALPPDGVIDREPLLADLDGDGHLDLVLGDVERTYIAFGDGRALSPARLWSASIGGEDSPVPMPLAAGDWSGDGAADLVLPYGFLVSERGAGRDDFRYIGLSASFGASWTEARVADLNGNGMLDVIATSSSKLDIDFFNGTGSLYLNPFVIPTERPVEHLAVGDFDGDLIDDLAFLQLGAVDEPSEVKVAFGAPAGPPTVLVTAARATGVMQVGALTNGSTDAAADLFLAYGQQNALGGVDSAFAWLTSFDRSLMCLVQLTTFAADGSIQSVPAWSLALGAFVEPGRPDAVLLSSTLEPGDIGLWWMPDLRGRTGHPELLGWGLDPRIEPLRDQAVVPRLELLMAAGDLDGDQLDELVLASPDRDDEHCLVARARLIPGDRTELESSPALRLDSACARSGQLAVRDLDADGAADIVLLTGDPSRPRSLLALWNDGTGGFSEDAVATLSRDDSPQAFTLFQPTPRDPLRLAYVTSTGLRVLQSTGSARTFEAISDHPALELQRATGIAAGDVDGDGITDLLVADSGNVQLLRAGLE